MSTITIESIRPESTQDAAEIMALAFYNKAFTSYMYNLSTAESKEIFQKGFYLRLKIYIETEQTAIAAIAEKRMIGALAMQSTQKNPSLIKSIGIIFPEVLSLLPLTTRIRWRRFLEASKTLKRPENLPTPHHYLDAVGVYPKNQGQGVGRLLLEKAHAICERDEESKGVYLFTAERKNVEIYQHLGYQILAQRGSPSLEVSHMFRPSKR